jgi:hypothetical protein
MDVYRGRKAESLENEQVRLTVLREGGHIAEFLDRRTGLNPLWTPPWDSVEPSAYDPDRHPEYGGGAEGPLLAGLMGHNLCLDTFGRPSPEEAAAGLPVHGEAGVAPFEVTRREGGLSLAASLPRAQLRFTRHLDLRGGTVRVRETVDNLSPFDRPIAWTQHVTLGPPFLERGVTQLRASATRGRVFDGDMGEGAHLTPGAEFDWPHAPRFDGTRVDLRTLNAAPSASSFATLLMDPAREHAWCLAFNPGARLTFGCVWRRQDFPWLGLWEEHHGRTHAPWNGRTSTLAFEFGASPFPEPRRAMIARGSLFGVPAFRWAPAGTRVEVEYRLVLAHGDAAPDTLAWPG